MTRHVGLGAIVAVGAGFRLWHLGASRLNYDESFTAMAARMPLDAMLVHLRGGDSHPPLDYLLRAPFARAGLNDTLIRMPSALCSIAALALFAWWMRERGRSGLLATGVMSLATFQIAYGREARMYAELQLIGVAVAVVADAWLRSPRRWHAPVIGILAGAALLTHTSGALLATGLLLVPGRRTDRSAWTWRSAVAAAAMVWAALWGGAFLVQARGGHSNWIPRSTAPRAVAVITSLVTRTGGAFELLAVGAIVVGGLVLCRRDSVLARSWMCLFVVPILLAVGIGRASPVLIDRTFTLFAWGAALATGVAIDALAPRTVAAGMLAFVAVVVGLGPGAVATANATSGPTPALNRLITVARPGDVVAVEPLSKGVELNWTLGVHSRYGPTDAVHLDLSLTPALQLTGAPRTGRVWLLDFYGSRPRLEGLPRCAPDWVRGTYRVECLELGSRLGPGRGSAVLSARHLDPPRSPDFDGSIASWLELD